MVLYFANSFSPSIRKDINSLFFSLKGLAYSLILAIIKGNDLKTSCKYPIKYLQIFFVSIKFEITILSTLTLTILIGYFAP